MNGNELERKLKTERVEACLNCQLFTHCEDIGKVEGCEEFVEVDSEKAMIIVSLDAYAKLESRRK